MILLSVSQDTITVRIDSTRGIYNYHWDGSGILDSDIGTPRVIQPGVYTVTITNPTTLCTDISTIDIIDDRIFTQVQISVDELDCQKDSVQILLINSDIATINYTGPSLFFSSSQSPFVSVPGIYTYSLINIKNCVTEGSIEVITNDTLPVLTIVPPVFTCFADSVQLFGGSTIPGTIFSWKGPSGFIKSGDGAYAYIGGDYMMQGIAPNGCKATLPFKITYDTLSPIFSIISPEVITCKKEMIKLSTTFDATKGSTIWLPEGIEMPVYEVTKAGSYIAEITGLNLCKSRDTIQVLEDKVFPTFEKSDPVINCRDSLGKIEIMPTSLFESVLWDNVNNPEVIALNKLVHVTKKPGIYSFDIQNVEGCITKGSIDVKEDKEKPKIVGIIQDTLDCIRPMGNIGAILDRDGIQFLWNGPPQSGVINQLTDSLLAVTFGGPYRLQVMGSNFCTEDTLINVVQNDDKPLYTFFTDTITCDKGKINIGINPLSNIINYEWSGPVDFMVQPGFNS
ncbi:MAG: hypothetical protein IPO92_17025 [Saprospiraceae bacterium]|nr:hypothetical protein [Saprospiraceae bacterium]